MGNSKLLGDNVTKCWQVTCDGLVSHPGGEEIFLVASYGRNRNDEIGADVSTLKPLKPNNDLSQISHCNIKSLSVIEVMRIENMITHSINI